MERICGRRERRLVLVVGCDGVLHGVLGLVFLLVISFISYSFHLSCTTSFRTPIDGWCEVPVPKTRHSGCWCPLLLVVMLCNRSRLSCISDACESSFQ